MKVPSDQAHLNNLHRTATPQHVLSGSGVGQGFFVGGFLRLWVGQWYGQVKSLLEDPSAQGWKSKGESESPQR